MNEDIDRPTLFGLFLACGKLSVSSFGGGVSGLMLNEFVVSRRWISESDFIDGLAVAQALPGVNVMNLALWVGYRMLGGPGAIVAGLGAVLPAAIIIVAAGAALQEISGYPLLALVLAGLGVAALGMSLNLVFRTMRRAFTHAVITLPIFAATVLAAAYHVPIVLTVAVLGPVSIALSYWKIKRGQE
jgi:chromate transporter